MQKIISIRLTPSQLQDETIIRNYLADSAGVKPASITGYNITRQSLDARGRQQWFNLTIETFINEPYHERSTLDFNFQDVSHASSKVIIVGAGPTGLFAALHLIESGLKPIILERGKDVRSRRRDLAALNKEGEVNPESNYCFGEGGAGTYSDGKLYTRSTKRGDINRILNLLVKFGAEDKILYEAHPHIGTNKLPGIITAIRKQILDAGGEFIFEKKVTDLLISNNTIRGVTTSNGEEFLADSVILATGHSARDIFYLLHKKQIAIEFKPFALGVRVEHPQQVIDCIQYHCKVPEKKDSKHIVRSAGLPPASYSLVQQVEGKGVFSFCMCPGGIIAPAATDPGELVVNGWSPSKRNNPYANSGIVVSIEEPDVSKFSKHGALAGMYFQQMVEKNAFNEGGGKFVAPAQRLVDFTNNKLSSSLPDCSYLPGINSVDLKVVLPKFVHERLKGAFLAFGQKMRGYLTNEAIVVATESRTSSPVRIPRDSDTLQHPQIRNLYPAGEGAGYAGGIVSAAMDGERVASHIAKTLKK